MDEPGNSRDETIASPMAAPVAVDSEPRAPWASAISMAEAGLLTDVGIVFDLAWIYVPILGTAFIPLIPTPFTILYLRRGGRITLFAACVAGFLMTVLVGPHYGWRLTLEACIGMAMGWAMRRRWSPLRAISLGLFVNATVAYVAAFVGIYALGLPLHDLYLELQNMLVSVGWLLDTSASLLGLQHAWLGVRPFFSAAAHVTLTYWIPMFYLYVVAIALPVDLLYYSVASSTAFALGHDVRPFPPPWVWRALRVVVLILSPFFWVARLLWRVVTLPLWGPVWTARWVAGRRRAQRLRTELVALASDGGQTSDDGVAPGAQPQTPAPEASAKPGAPLLGAAAGRETRKL